jgi:hypothetical protein
MKNLSKIVIAALSAVLLSACGGGGDGAPFVISNAQAVSALTTAKAVNNTFVTDWVHLSNVANPILVLTASSWPSGNASASNLSCAVSGTYSYASSKAFGGSGLSTGDYYSVTYSDCRQTSGGPLLRGNVVISAASNTFTNQSSGAFDLPVNVTFNDFREGAINFNGAVNYSTNTVGKSGVGSESIVASASNFTVTSTNSATTYSNAALVYTVTSAGTKTSGAVFDQLVSPSGSQMSVNSSLVGAPGAPTSGRIIVTNVFGGRIIGTIASNQIEIDDGNDGTINASFIQAF